MSVISVNELFHGRTAKVNEKFETSYVRMFDVVLSDQHLGGLTAMLAVTDSINVNDGYNTGYEFDTHAVCKGLDASCVSGDGKRWEVKVEYGPTEPLFENPLDKPIELDITEEKRDRAVDWDINGEALVNTANDPFDPAITIDDPRTVISIKRNEADDPRPLAAVFRNTINSSEFLGYPEKTVRCESIKGKRVWSANLFAFYYEVDYEFHVQLANDAGEPGWTSSPVNQGLRQLKNGKPVPILEGSAPVSSPKLLDEGGAPLADGDPPYILKFEIYNEVDFNVFGFDI